MLKETRHLPGDIFSCIFLTKRLVFSLKVFTEIYSSGSNQQLGLVIGLVLDRRLVIIWSNVDQNQWDYGITRPQGVKLSYRHYEDTVWMV